MLPTAIERFQKNIVVDEKGCWLWTASKGKGGYGRFYDHGHIYAHVWSYKHYKGEISKGFVIDHICRVTRCVNPIHLEAVTQKENVFRGVSTMAEAARKTHCSKGHPLFGQNLYVSKVGTRKCRQCVNQSALRYYHKHPEKYVAYAKTRRQNGY